MFLVIKSTNVLLLYDVNQASVKIFWENIHVFMSFSDDITQFADKCYMRFIKKIIYTYSFRLFSYFFKIIIFVTFDMHLVLISSFTNSCVAIA